MAELVENFLPGRLSDEDRHITMLEKDGALPTGLLQSWDQFTQSKMEPDEEVDELEEAIQQCLEENSELAMNERNMEMLYYCLKNYVNFHPDFAGLPIKERVAEAGRMAKDFLGEAPGPGNC